MRTWQYSGAHVPLITAALRPLPPARRTACAPRRESPQFTRHVAVKRISSRPPHTPDYQKNHGGDD
eukprot:5257130-Prymnesium_polylepis.1